MAETKPGREKAISWSYVFCFMCTGNVYHQQTPTHPLQWGVSVIRGINCLQLAAKLLGVGPNTCMGSPAAAPVLISN